MQTIPSTSSIIILALISVSLLGCGEKTAKKKSVRSHLVDVEVVEKKSISIERTRSGTLKAVREIMIQNQEEGRIIAMPFHEADKVSKGTVLARLDDRLLRAQLARTKALRRKAEKDLKRIKGLASKQLMAQVELTKLETELAVSKADEQELLTRLDYAVIRAPIDGIISYRNGEEGSIAERYTHLLTVSDQSALITEVTVSELLINKLDVGDSVSLMIDALGQQTEHPSFEGKISRIYPNVNPVTRTGTLDIALSPVPAGARPGQLVRVVLKTQTAERLLIPFIALRRSTEEDYVFTVDADNRVQKQALLTGLRIDDQIEVLSGLSSGDRVVVRGFTNLRDNKKVTLAGAAQQEKNKHSANTANATATTQTP